MESRSGIWTMVASTWNIFAQFAVWVLTIVGSFLIPPPIMQLSENSKTIPFTTFLIAALAALLFIPFRMNSLNRHYRLWYTISCLSLVLFLITFFYYQHYLHNWTINYYDTATLIKGDDMLYEAREKYDSLAKIFPTIDDQLFLKMRTGKSTTIWSEAVIRKRYYILSGLYILTTVFTSFFILTIIQAIYSSKEKTRHY